MFLYCSEFERVLFAWIKYFDIRTSIMLVCKDLCLGLFALRNLWRPSFDGDILYPYMGGVFYDAVISSGVIVRVPV